LLWSPAALCAQQEDTILKRQLLNGMFPPKEQDARPSIRPSVPVVVAVALARQGIPIETVTADLTPLLSAGVSDGSLLELVARVGLATARGNPVLPAYRAQLGVMQHNRVVALGEADGTPFATFVVRDSNVFIRAGGESVWLSPTINCMVAEGHPPAVTTHAQVRELVQRWVEQSKPMREKTEAPPGVAIVLTQDTATIAGVHTRRLNITDGGVFQGEMWVAPTEVPTSLREVGQRLLAALPPDYWRWVHGHPGYSEIILAYGIPLRHRLASGKDLQLLPSSNSAPSWVDPLQAACAQKHASSGIER
jgi:hypothetical protein